MSYFTTRGRTNRWKYFIHIIPPSLIGAIGMQMSTISDPIFEVYGSVISGAAAIIFLIPAVRRLHDLNYSGWWALLFIVPVFNLVLGLGLLFVKGTGGPNRYGADPLHQNEKKCPECAEYIKLEARTCRYCGREFSEEEVDRQIKKKEQESRWNGGKPDEDYFCEHYEVAVEPNHDMTCPACGDEVDDTNHHKV